MCLIFIFMRLKDLLPENIRRELNLEAFDMPPSPPPIQFHISPPTAKQSFYQNKDVNFNKPTKAKDFRMSRDFIDYVKNIENDAKVGYNKSLKRWLPHSSPEGGLPTIAYGHKLTQQELSTMSRGITDEEAEKLLQKDLEHASRAALSYVQDKFGKTQLTDEQIEMLTEFVFNLGSLKKFPKFTEAVIKRDWRTANKEYKRSYVDPSGNRKELSGRNVAFYKRYLSDKVA